jgi:hypothetical protein
LLGWWGEGVRGGEECAFRVCDIDKLEAFVCVISFSSISFSPSLQPSGTYVAGSRFSFLYSSIVCLCVCVFASFLFVCFFLSSHLLQSPPKVARLAAPAGRSPHHVKQKTELIREGELRSGEGGAAVGLKKGGKEACQKLTGLGWEWEVFEGAGVSTCGRGNQARPRGRIEKRRGRSGSGPGGRRRARVGGD